MTILSSPDFPENADVMQDSKPLVWLVIGVPALVTIVIWSEINYRLFNFSQYRRQALKH